MSQQPRLFYHETVPAAARVATAIGITMAGFVAGQTASASYQATPAIMDAPAPLLAKQWKKLYDIGFRVGPATYIFNSVTFGWLASREPTSSPAFKLYLAAAIIIPSSILYTIVVIKPINDKLEQKVESLAGASLTDVAVESGVSREETTHALVDKWATLNLGRAVISVTGALCATYAALSKIDVRGVSAIRLGSGADRMG